MSVAKKSKTRVPRSEWTPDEIEFDRIVRLMESRNQMNRIEGRLCFYRFNKRFDKQQIDAMWERIK